jgi:Reverse transcriptase (RNA-dependent DNA polymerase)
MRLDTLQLLLAFTTLWGLAVHVVDIVGAYLNGDLKEEIYMQQPPEYNDGTGRVWKLIKTIYRLRQSGHVWNDKLNQAFLRLGFKCLIADQCVYIRNQDQDLVIVTVHIDDMAIFTSNDALTNLKDELRKEFTITDLGELK